MKRLLLMLIAVVAAAMATIPSAQAATRTFGDQIKPVPGKGVMVQCSIEDEDIDKVTYITSDGKEKTIPQADVEYVRYYDKPSRLSAADRAFEEGRYVDAIDNYMTVLASGRGRSFWVKPHCYYHLAESYRRMEPPDEAKATEYLEKLNTEFPDNKYMGSALATQAGLLMANDKPAEALKVYEKIERERGPLGAPRFGEKVRLDARLGQVQCLTELNRANEAIDKLEQIERAIQAKGSEFIDLLYEVKVERVRVYAALDQIDQARAEGEKIIQEATDEYNAALKSETFKERGRALRRGLARCHNVMGDIYLEKGGDDNVREALLHYMWTVAVFTAPPAQHAKALFKAGECRQKLGQEDKAQQLWGRLKQKYEKSDWVKRIP